MSAPSIPVVTPAPYTWPLVHPYPPASAPLLQVPSALVPPTQNVQGSSFPLGSVHWGSFSGSGLKFGHGSSHLVPDPNFRNTPFGQSFANKGSSYHSGPHPSGPSLGTRQPFRPFEDNTDSDQFCVTGSKLVEG